MISGSRARARGYLDSATIGYLKLQLDSGNADQTKKGLQALCKAHREGYRLPPDTVFGVEVTLVGLLNSMAKKPGLEKLRRWCLNAIARFGSMTMCAEAVIHVLSAFSDEPQTVAAAIAALYKISKNAARQIEGVGVDRQLVTLAALQHVPPSKLDMAPLPIVSQGVV